MRYLLLLFFLVLPLQHADSAWFNNSWNYKVKVEVNPNKVGTTTAITSFPVYVDLAGMPSTFWTNASSTGADIRVVESDDTTETAFEIVSFATTTQRGELHFMADALATTSTSTFYIYYGNVTATAYTATDTYGRNNVWSDYIRVYHGNNTTDSSGNATATLNAFTSATTSQNKVGYYSFYTSTEDTTRPIDAGSVTGRSIQGWVRPTGSNANNYVFDIRTGLANGYLMLNSLTFFEFGAGLTYVYKNDTLATTGVSTWADNNTYMYTARTASTWTDANVTFNFRYTSVGATDTLKGWQDEIRITKTIDFSTSTILTTYNNQSSTSTFLWIGPEEARSTSTIYYSDDAFWFE